MKRFKGILLVVVLLAVAVAPAAGAPPEESFSVDAYAYTDAGEVAAYGHYYSGEGWSVISVSSPDFTCLNDEPSIDVQKLVSFHGNGEVNLKIEFPSSECDYYGGVLPDTITADVSIVAENLYHGTSHQNVVKGSGDSRNCQVWYGSPVEASGSIGGHVISETYWGGMYNETCRYSGK